MKKRSISRLALSAAVLTSVVGVTDASAQKSRKSSGKDRSSVSITVYNQNFGLVREVREVSLGTGTIALDFLDVAAQIQPETVHIKSLSGPGQIQVLEQNYRYDLLTPAKLLEKYVGKKLQIYRMNEKLGREEKKEARLLSYVSGQAVLEIDGQITSNYGGRFAFPKMPANLMSKPTLTWLLESKRAKQKVEVTYLTRGIGWETDYVMVVDQNDAKGDLNGWVTLKNRSGARYDNAKLKLVAGDVQRVSATPRSRPGLSMKSSGARQAHFNEESFFEYHLYSLSRPTTVAEKETKQVSLLSANDVKTEKKLIFYGGQYYYRGRYGQVTSNQKIGVYLDLQNSKKNGLGMPLPKGTVRVYKKDKSGAAQFIGEDRIDHTPRNERIRIKMGEAFDVVGERKQMEWKTLGRCTSESSWEISLRNHKKTAEKVLVVEPVGGDWTILRSSHPSKKKDAHTFHFDVRVPARGETKIKYRVRVKWC